MKKRTKLLTIPLCAALISSVFCGCGPAPEVDSIDDNYRVFYQIFVGSFSDSDGDGVGDLRGIINRMDYLNDGNIHSGKSLGVQGIWLSPIFKSPTYHKYDTVDYYEIDPKFGTQDDLNELINLCHQRNVKIILDLAINHTSTGNEWFKKFSSARQHGRTDDEFYDFYSCATYSTMQNGHMYYSVPGCSDFVYEANFDSGMPELNYDCPAAKSAVLDVAKFYLEKGIDGFRFDAIKYIYLNDTPKNVDFWYWYISELKKINPDIYTVGECWSSDAEILQYYRALNCFSFDSSQPSGTIANAARGQIDVFTRYIENFQKTAKARNSESMYIPFIANHDTDRAAGFLPLEQSSDEGTVHRAYMAANLYLLCNGSPVIYYGEEIGMKGTRGAANTDANRRLAMLWGDDDTIRNPLGSTFKDELQINGTVADQKDDENSLMNYYSRVISIRNKYPQIARGDYSAIIGDGNYGGFTIDYNGEKTILLHNVSLTEVQIDIDDLPVSISQIKDYIGQGKATLKNGVLTLSGETSVILQ